MQFYPNTISVNEVAFAVSASIARSGSLIEKFAAVPITASLALNIRGSTGTAGTNAGPISGPKGAQGQRGVTGLRGDSVYLLSSSWHDESKGGASCSSAPANCYPYDFWPSYRVGGVRVCDYSGFYITYYSTDLTLGAGSPMFYNEVCTNPALDQKLGAYQIEQTVYNTDANGDLVIVGSCEQSL